MLYTIGDFGKRTGLTPRALRLYDERGLLRAHRDPTNDHRYYREVDLLPARRIALLRALGFSLSDITDLVAALDDPEEERVLHDVFHAALQRSQQERETLATREVTLRTTLRLLAATSAPDLSELAMLRPETRRTLMTHYRTTSARFTLQGPRAEQQDAVLTHPTPTGGVYAVADGSGADGATISRQAVEGLLHHLDTERLTPSRWAHHLRTVFAAIHADVGGLDGATTLTVLILDDGVAFVAHVGDSSVLRVDDGLTRLTHDHTVVQRLVDDGALASEEAAGHPDALVLHQAVGAHVDDVHVHREEARSGVRYVLTTDGVSRVVERDLIHRIVRESADAEDAARALIGRAGADDNAAVVVVEV